MPEQLEVTLGKTRAGWSFWLRCWPTVLSNLSLLRITTRAVGSSGAALAEYEAGRYTVVGNLAVKAVEQFDGLDGRRARRPSKPWRDSMKWKNSTLS